MRATKFEFAKRFWIICAIYAVGFFLINFDHVGMIGAIRSWLALSVAPGTAESATVTRIVIAIGALLVFVAAAVRTWGAAYLRSDVVHDTSQHSEALVADGPFRYTRNPLYLANLPMALGIGLLASRLGCIFLVLANWILVYRLIFREEEALRRDQGEAYLAYCRAVPRFWPSLHPRVPSGGRSPRWAQAFMGETFIWVFGIGELALAATLNAQVGYVIFITGFVAHFITSGLLKRNQSPPQPAA